MIKAFYSKQFIAFLLTGGFAALVNFCSRILYNIWLNFSTAIILAYITGMITAFVLAKYFVFTNSAQALHRSMLFFGLVNLFAVAQTWAISMGLAYYLLPTIGMTVFVPEFAHAVGVMFPVFTSYIGHKYISFREATENP